MRLPPVPAGVTQHLAEASAAAQTRRATDRRFVCQIFGPEWNAFVEQWAPTIYDFVGHALGPYGTEPLPEILRMHDGDHAAGATASFHPGTGQVTLAGSVEGKPGQTLEKLTHEFTHGSLARFPEGDMFYEEGVVDFAVWVMAHAPIWGPHRNDMISAAAFNIRVRRDRAMKTHTEYDAKRWAGGLFASLAYGPFIIPRLRQKKMDGDYTW